MSQLAQLKQTLNGISGSAKKASSNLSSFERTFAQQTSTVQQAVGGSAQRKDAEIISALQAASKAVRQASQSLQHAAQVASQYGQTL